MAAKGGKEQIDWASEGLRREEAANRWSNYFAARQGTPIEVSVYDSGAFTARLTNRGVGQLRVLRLQAPAQRLVHRGNFPKPGSHGHLFHFIFVLRGTINASIREKTVSVMPGHALMLDNSAHYELDMKDPHEVIDLIMPAQWLEQFLPAPFKLVGQTVPLNEGWAPPLAAMLQTITLEGGEFPAPRPVMAEQLGMLLAFAMRSQAPNTAKPLERLAQQIMHRIENSYADPELTPDKVAAEFKISKRYLQSLLAKSGTSFVRELNAARLDRASELLNDPLSRSLPISEVAYRCGFLDPAYFTRQFRKRFDTTPRIWGQMR